MPMMFMKESKSAVTIRRRRQRAEGGFRHKASSADENTDLTEEDPDPLLEAPPPLWIPVLRMIMSSEKTLFLGLLAFRVVNALMIQTSYVPDEFWQSTEVAHNMAFGYGYLTWEWQVGIRSYLYPGVFAALFKLLAFLKLDTRLLLIKLPRLLQAVFAAFSDLYLFKFSCKLQNQDVGLWALFCHLTSWFTFYCATRTLTNSMETTLTIVALYYFPWPGKPRKAHWKYISIVGLAVMIRPTAAILWLPLCCWHVLMYQTVARRVLKLFLERGLMLLALSSVIDRIFYGKWINVHWRFLETNVVSNIGAIYGTHPWHWYLTQGFPVLLGSHVFIFIAAARQSVEKACLALIAWTVFAYSLLAHKEFRFLMQLLPVCMHVCACYIHHMLDEGSDEVDPARRREDENAKPAARRKCSRKMLVVVFLVMTNLPLALYTCVIHQRGTVDVMRFLHGQIQQQQHTSILFLMPCHSTPYYSYIHHNVTMRFLTCEPNLEGKENYTEEADHFYSSPSSWLQQQYQDAELPSHLVMFSNLEADVADFTVMYNYTDCASFFHTHAPEGRVGSHVMVKCLHSYKPRIPFHTAHTR